MAKVDVIATRRATFAKAGTRRSVTASEAKILVTGGYAMYANPGEAPRRGYLRRDMVAESAAVAPAEPPPQRPRARRASSTAEISAATTAQRDDGEA